MSKKMFNLIVGIVTGAEAISEAVVTYFQPPMATAIVTAIPIAGTAVVAVCKCFVKEE